MENVELLPCPFCGGGRIDYTVKSTPRDKRFTVAMYCRSCHASGKRVTVSTKEFYRYDVEKNPTYRRIAEQAWNDRRAAE